MKNGVFTILAADDNPVIRKTLKAMLSKAGYRVITCADGREARESALREPPDLILLDVEMPVEDGFTACEHIMRTPKLMDIPIIFISGEDDTKSRVKGLEMGALDYISKPFIRAEVLARVRNYLRLRRAFLRVIEEQAERLKQVGQAQQAILTTPEEVPEARFQVRYIPVLEAGGDFYDVFEIAPKIFGFFVADISGHDLGASFATSALKALVRQNASPLFKPDMTLRILNSIVISLFQEGQHLTAAYITLNRNNSLLTVVNAAHLPVLILPPEGEPLWLKADSDVIGIFEDALFESREITVSPGSRIFLFTDGLLEIFAGIPRNRQEGLTKLVANALASKDMEPNEAINFIIKGMFGRGQEPEDDIILLSVDV